MNTAPISYIASGGYYGIILLNNVFGNELNVPQKDSQVNGGKYENGKEYSRCFYIKSGILCI